MRLRSLLWHMNRLLSNQQAAYLIHVYREVRVGMAGSEPTHHATTAQRLTPGGSPYHPTRRAGTWRRTHRASVQTAERL